MRTYKEIAADQDALMIEMNDASERIEGMTYEQYREMMGNYQKRFEELFAEAEEAIQAELEARSA